MQHYLVLSTCPDLDCARALADLLVRERLAACVNIVPAVHSVYEWKGTVQQDTECQLLIKTTRERYAALEETLRRNHPYELPEIIAVPLTTGLPAYLHWINHQTENNE